MTKTALTDPSHWVERYGDSLYRYALLRLQSRELAEDLIQETFAAALRNRSSFSGHSSERTWLIGILKHKIVDYLRAKYREQSNVALSVEMDRLRTRPFTITPLARP